MQKIKATLLSLVLICAPFIAFAAEGDVFVGAEEQVSGDLLRAGRSVRVQAAVPGNVLAVGASIDISGPVGGDVVVAGGEVVISSDVAGSIFAVGGTIEISGTVGGSVIVGGGKVHLTETANVGGSVIIGASEAVLRGIAKHDIRFFGDALLFGGEASQNLYVKASDGNRVILERTAVVQGDFEYTSHGDASLREGALVKGATNHIAISVPSARARIGAIALGRLISMFGMIVVGLVFVALAPKAVEDVTEGEFLWRWSNVGMGIIWLVLTPLVSLLLLFTIIGVPLALILFALWAVMVFCAQVVVAIGVGRVLLIKILSMPKPSLFMQLAFGTLTWVVVTRIPLFGWVLCMVGIAIGLGALVAYKKQELVRYRSS